MTEQAELRIGQVVNLLRDEFPDVSISKLRFLEEQGLVEPRRTAGGYRMYSADHVRELRRILRMQRDEFLPLKVIREELRRRVGEPGTRPGATGEPERRFSLREPVRPVGVDEVCARARVPESFVEECRSYGLVVAERDASGRLVLSSYDSDVVVAAAEMARLGIDVRHLRSLRSAIARQTGLVEQYAAARLRSRSPEQRDAEIANVESVTEAMTRFMRQAFLRDVRAVTSDAVKATTPSRSSGSTRQGPSVRMRTRH